MENKKKVVIVTVLLLVLGLVSFTVVGNYWVEPENHQETIQTLDKKSGNVMAMATSAAAISTGLTILPNDMASPIADELANLSSTMVMILCAIFLEKYLLTLAGAVTFKILIPFVCLLFILYMFNNKEIFKVIAIKILVVGLAFVLLVPASTTATNFIEDTYAISIEENLEKADEVANILNNKADENESKINKWINNLKDGAKGLLEDVKVVLKSIIEMTAVMIVTSCVIPLLTFAALLWVLNMVLGIPIPKAKLRNFAKVGSKLRQKATGNKNNSTSLTVNK